MTREQFKVLEYLEAKKEHIILENTLIENIDVKKELIIEAIKELISQEKIYKNIENGLDITSLGYVALEPYRVKRAIFIAAGMGARLQPYTNELPKPLIKVGKVSMIETLLQAVYKAEINEVIIIRGHLKEKFDILLEKYPNIQFIDNDIYKEFNNISSVHLVKEKLGNAYILEADLVLFNENIITKYQYISNYIGEYKEYTNDWRFEVKDGKIIQALVEGYNCYHMYGISYWTEKEAVQLAKDLEYEMKQEGAYKRYWDEVAVNLYSRNVEIRPVQAGEIVEIDTVEELEAIKKIIT
ncbi:MAG: sugar phosphate nucleotidyltransferase [Cellulosilyticaceae bacterium]